MSPDAILAAARHTTGLRTAIAAARRALEQAEEAVRTGRQDEAVVFLHLARRALEPGACDICDQETERV